MNIPSFKVSSNYYQISQEDLNKALSKGPQKELFSTEINNLFQDDLSNARGS